MQVLHHEQYRALGAFRRQPLDERAAHELAEQHRIAAHADAIVALETAGRTLDRLSSIFGVHTDNLNVGPIPDIERTVQPKLAEYQDSITQHEKLFARIEAVYENQAAESLDRSELAGRVAVMMWDHPGQAEQREALFAIMTGKNSAEGTIFTLHLTGERRNDA